MRMEYKSKKKVERQGEAVKEELIEFLQTELAPNID